MLDLPGCCFAFALLVSFEQGSHFNFFIELHSSVRLAGLLVLICLILFGWCFRHSLHQIGQQFAFHRPARRTKCNGCFPIKVKENFTPPSSFQRFQICPDIVFLQLTFVNCIISYTVEYRCITCFSISPDN